MEHQTKINNILYTSAYLYMKIIHSLILIHLILLYSTGRAATTIIVYDNIGVSFAVCVKIDENTKITKITCVIVVFGWWILLDVTSTSLQACRRRQIYDLAK